MTSRLWAAVQAGSPRLLRSVARASDLVVFKTDAFDVDAESSAQLQQAGVRIETAPVRPWRQTATRFEAVHESKEPPLTDFWESTFTKMRLVWGREPTASASLAGDYFARAGVKDVLIPGIGYGRNAKPFLERGMSVTGIEISETAIAIARSQLGLEIPIVHGLVTDMPFDHRHYDGIFCFGLVYLFDARGREKLIRDCYRQLVPGGHMIFTVISKKAPMYGQGRRLGEDWYERLPGVPMYFYDTEAVRREFGAYGLVECSEIDEPSGSGATLPFMVATCKRDAAVA